MSDLPSCGSVRFGEIEIPIVDCVNWRLRNRESVCKVDRDVTACATCDARATRNGNVVDPPIFDVTVSAPARAALVADPEPDPEPSRWRGLGDVIASATKAVGITPCGGCQQRREALNRLVPFAEPPNPAPEPMPREPG